MLWLHTSYIVASILCILAIYCAYWWSSEETSALFCSGPHMQSANRFWHKDVASNAKWILCLSLGGFAIIRFVISLLFWSCLMGDMARHLPWYLVKGWSHATAMPNRIGPISGCVCRLELTVDTDHLWITDTTILQAAGRDYTQGWSTFYTSNDNGESVVFCGKKAALYLRTAADSLSLCPSGFCALPLKPSWES